MKRAAFTNSRFILCEGNEDAAVIRDLLQTRALGNFEVSPTVDIGSTQGNSGFENALIACEAITGFTNVKDVVLVADNDDHSTASFASVISQLKAAKAAGSRNWGIPTTPFSKAAGSPSVTVWMWPDANTKGCLETVLWRMVLRKYAALAACIDAAITCAGIGNWPVSKKDKARVRCFIALYHRRQPGIALGNLWKQDRSLLPTAEAEFTPLFQFLSAV